MKRIRRNYKKELEVSQNTLANAEKQLNNYDYRQRESEKRIAELETRLTEARRHLLPFGAGDKMINFLPLGVVEYSIDHDTREMQTWNSPYSVRFHAGSRVRLVVIASMADGIDLQNIVKIGGKQSTTSP